MYWSNETSTYVQTWKSKAQMMREKITKFANVTVQRKSVKDVKDKNF